MTETPNGVPIIYGGEAQLLSWSDTSTAGPKIVLALPDEHALEKFKSLTMGRKAGQHLMIAVSLLGDDGSTPIREPNALVKSAGVVCKAADFQRYVAHQTGEEFELAEEREEAAAEYVRKQCGVESRRDLDKDRVAGERFGVLMRGYRAFLGKPNEKVDTWNS